MMDSTYLLAAFAFFIGAFIYGLLTLLVWQKNAKHEGDWVFLFTMTALAYGAYAMRWRPPSALY